MHKAFFLDRDGVIIQMIYDRQNDLIHTVQDKTQIRFVPGVFAFLKKTKQLGFKKIMISNQPDIGLKKISRDNFNRIREKIQQELKKRHLALDGEYYCFHHPYALEPQRKKVCDCRKPKTGLFIKAAQEHKINLKQSWMIGDGVNDILAGYKAGCKTILLANTKETEYLRLIEKKLKGITPNHIVKDLKEALSIL